MATDKSPKRRRKERSDEPSDERSEPSLQTRSDPRSERRYEPKSGVSSIITIASVAVGALLAGAGTYAQWLRSESLGPHKSAPFLLAAGAVVMILVAIFGSLGTKPIRVGDAGVAIEKNDTELDRIGWYEVTRITLTNATLTIHGQSSFIVIPLAAHLQAAARALAEAQRRIPSRTEGIKTDGLDKLDDAQGEVLKLDAPQAAGLHCKASDKIIAFERDARFCGRCGEIYHKDAVPKRCVTCEGALRA